MKTTTITATIWVPILLVLLTLAVVGGMQLGGDDKTRAVADDCFSDLVVKQQTGQIGRYGTVDGLGGNAPLTHLVLKSICEDAWSVEGPSRSPMPFACPDGLLIREGTGTPHPDPDCTAIPTCDATASNGPCHLPSASPTIDASPVVQTPTETCPPRSVSLLCRPTPTPFHTLNCASPPQGFSTCLWTPTPTAATLPDTGGKP